ncbi:hypothetical protein DF165_07475 [Burkholderia cenocepacia]|nr:hypothetical protein C6T64_00610 [Burkholderia cenocepacia]RQT99009.1 hypothetical protein DF165_07475 [Burkholderia cenocepacia]
MDDGRAKWISLATSSKGRPNDLSRSNARNCEGLHACKGGCDLLYRLLRGLHRQPPVPVGKIASETLTLVCVQDLWSRSVTRCR